MGDILCVFSLVISVGILEVELFNSEVYAFFIFYYKNLYLYYKVDVNFRNTREVKFSNKENKESLILLYGQIGG